jgi:hypothetical protein
MLFADRGRRSSIAVERFVLRKHDAIADLMNLHMQR